MGGEHSKLEAEPIRSSYEREISVQKLIRAHQTAIRNCKAAADRELVDTLKTDLKIAEELQNLLRQALDDGAIENAKAASLRDELRDMYTLYYLVLDDNRLLANELDFMRSRKSLEESGRGMEEGDGEDSRRTSSAAEQPQKKKAKKNRQNLKIV